MCAYCHYLGTCLPLSPPLDPLRASSLCSQYIKPNVYAFWKSILDRNKQRYLFIYLFTYFKDFIYLFLERGEGREGKHQCKINIDQLLPQPGTEPATQACALTRNPTGNLSLCETMPSRLSHTSQGLNRYKHRLLKRCLSAHLTRCC